MQIINTTDVEAQFCVAGVVSEKVGQLLHEHIIDSVERHIKCKFLNSSLFNIIEKFNGKHLNIEHLIIITPGNHLGTHEQRSAHNKEVVNLKPRLSEESQLACTLEVLHLHNSERITVFRLACAYAGDNASERELRHLRQGLLILKL